MDSLTRRSTFGSRVPTPLDVDQERMACHDDEETFIYRSSRDRHRIPCTELLTMCPRPETYACLPVFIISSSMTSADYLEDSPKDRWTVP